MRFENKRNPHRCVTAIPYRMGHSLYFELTNGDPLNANKNPFNLTLSLGDFAIWFHK
jgi:hypothetical protein